MRIGRTLPPAAAHCGWRDLVHGIGGACRPARSLQARTDELRRELGVAHVFLVSSGTAALTLTLTALTSLSEGSEVVLPAYTCFSVPAAVVHAGLDPILCDIDESSFDFDHGQLPSALTSRTLGVIAHHLFGLPSNIERTNAVCRPRSIFVIEDAAQALGVRRNGQALGTFGDVGILSFGRGKHITCGSGGAVVTNSDRIAEAIAARYREVPAPPWWDAITDFVSVVLMMVFIRPWLYWIPTAIPFLRLGATVFPRRVTVKRLSGFKAGLLRRWRSNLAKSTDGRSAIARDLARHLATPIAGTSARPLLRFPLLTVSHAEREQIHFFSKTRGLGLSRAYPTAVNEVAEIRTRFGGQQFPAAASVASRLLTLPTHQWLTEEDKHAIAEICRASCCAC